MLKRARRKAARKEAQRAAVRARAAARQSAAAEDTPADAAAFMWSPLREDAWIASLDCAATSASAVNDIHSLTGGTLWPVDVWATVASARSPLETTATATDDDDTATTNTTATATATATAAAIARTLATATSPLQDWSGVAQWRKGMHSPLVRVHGALATHCRALLQADGPPIVAVASSTGAGGSPSHIGLYAPRPLLRALFDNGSDSDGGDGGGECEADQGTPSYDIIVDGYVERVSKLEWLALKVGLKAGLPPLLPSGLKEEETETEEEGGSAHAAMSLVPHAPQAPHAPLVPALIHAQRIILRNCRTGSVRGWGVGEGGIGVGKEDAEGKQGGGMEGAGSVWDEHAVTLVNPEYLERAEATLSNAEGGTGNRGGESERGQAGGGAGGSGESKDSGSGGGKLLTQRARLRRKDVERHRRTRNRFGVFASFVQSRLGVGRIDVLDVAGGRGHLAFELAVERGIPTTVVDSVPVKLSAFKSKRLLGVALHMSTEYEGQRDGERRLAEKRGEQSGEQSGERRSSGDGNDGNRDDGDDEGDDDGGEGGSGDHFLDRWIHPSLALDVPMNLSPIRQAQRRALRWASHAGRVPLAQHRCLFHSDPARRRAEHPELQGAFERCSVVLGLHPDQATEPIVDACVAAGKPFVVVPCCVFPSENPGRRDPRDGRPVRVLEQYIRFLQAKDERIRVEVVEGMQGCNTALTFLC